MRTGETAAYIQFGLRSVAGCICGLGSRGKPATLNSIRAWPQRFTMSTWALSENSAAIHRAPNRTASGDITSSVFSAALLNCRTTEPPSSTTSPDFQLLAMW